MALAMWNGSVCVTTTVGTSPMPRVTGATLAAISTASSRPRTWPAPVPGPGSKARLSSKVTKSRRAASASATRSVQYPADSSSAGLVSGSRQAAGCQPAPSSATARCSGGRWGCVTNSPYLPADRSPQRQRLPFAYYSARLWRIKGELS